jgi:hypothetical protein
VLTGIAVPDTSGVFAATMGELRRYAGMLLVGMFYLFYYHISQTYVM